MKETLVNFETAKMLKEAEFDWECNNYFIQSGKKVKDVVYNDWNHFHEKSVSAPTLSLAQKWLRDVHKIDVVPYPVESWKTNIVIEQTENIEYHYWMWKNAVRIDTYGMPFSSSEQALEAGITEALKLLK